jgi:osmotically inducible lipoprotein OsmB
MTKTIKIFSIIVLTTGLGACAGMSNTEKGTLIGAGTGAAVGSVITGGSPVGTVVGAGVGGVIGHEIGADEDRRRGYR